MIIPQSAHSVFEYRVKIKNVAKKGGLVVQLLSRHWWFLDWDQGTVVEVCGKGVAGTYPLLLPGEEHTYSSGTDLQSQHGVMKGIFQVARFATEPVEGAPADGGGTEGAKASTKKDKEKKGEDPGRFVDIVDVKIAPTLLKSQS
jgi:uncharacterized protein affecting Mg2+/Co2+ transport